VTAPSYSGLVRRPLTAVTRVRIPLGSPTSKSVRMGALPLFRDEFGGGAPVTDVAARDRSEQALALLELLAIGDREIERGELRDADDLYAELAEPRR
jgi:hypothetical protein